jgi:hypothetical protein
MAFRWICLLLLPAVCCVQAFVTRTPLAISRSRTLFPHQQQRLESSVDETDYFFASTVSTVQAPKESTTTQSETLRSSEPVSRRILGSQELLMLPRQYGPSATTFPPMNHVVSIVLSATPSPDALATAIDSVMTAHPLLSARVDGTGEPSRRIDLLQMVREGEPSPLTFVSSAQFSAKDVLTVVDANDLDASWKASFSRDLDNGQWCNVTTGPLWKVELHRTAAAQTDCALVLSFNHAISDQSSANRLVDAIVRNLAEMEAHNGVIVTPLVVQSMPVALEDSVLGLGQGWSSVQAAGVTPNTIRYVASKAAEGFKNPVILPDDTVQSEAANSNPLTGALSIIMGRTAGGQDEGSTARQSTVQFRTLSATATSQLLAACRARGVSISNALTAAATLTATDFIASVATDDPKRPRQSRNYKILQSLDMRRFGAQLDQGETVACMAGSHDLIHGPLPDWSGRALRTNPSLQRLAQFWDLAAEGKQQTEDFINSNGPTEAVRVFDFAMTVADLNNLVHLTGQSKDTKGRAYSVGVTNVGVYERQLAFRREGESSRDLLRIQHGRYRIKQAYFATPHVTSGCLFLVSGMTVDGQLQFTFNPVEPIVRAETNMQFADAFIEVLEKVSDDDPVEHVDEATEPVNAIERIMQPLPLVAAVLGSAAIASHAGAWASFFSSVMEMKANVADPADFWAAMNFWIFFAVGHPILQPILWISDVLHGSPGPMVAGLVPASFLLGNVIVIAALTFSKEVRTLPSSAESAVDLRRHSVCLCSHLLTDSKRSQHCTTRCVLDLCWCRTGRHCWSGRFQSSIGRQLQRKGCQRLSVV